MKKEAKVSIPLIVGGLVLVIIVGAGGIFLSLRKTTTESTTDTSTTQENNSTRNSSNSDQTTTSTDSEEESTNNQSYKDGTYTATGTYASPAGSNESIKVDLSIENNTISSVTVIPNATNPTSASYQAKFKSGISNKVVGKKLSEVTSLGSVNGSSLSSKGFMNALDQIKAEAEV